MATGNDFVQVQLTAAGIALAEGHPLTISSGRRSFTFPPGIPQRVEKSYEWNAVLKTSTDRNGNPLFELAGLGPVAVPAPQTEAGEPEEPAATHD